MSSPTPPHITDWDDFTSVTTGYAVVGDGEETPFTRVEVFSDQQGL